MAGITAYLNNSAAVAVTPGGNEILAISAPAQQRLLIKEIEVEMEQATGVAPTNESVDLTIIRCTALGTGTGLTPIKHNVTDDETLQATGRENLTAGSTPDATIKRKKLYPLMGDKYHWIAPRREDMIPVKGGQGVSIKLDPDYATTTRNYWAKITYEE